jgi:hypothetical protein
MILEENSTHLGASAEATVYTAGSAIGNGLGNAYDTLAITCANTTLLSIAYNITALGAKEGDALAWDAAAGGWSIGNATPGIAERRESTATNATAPQATIGERMAAEACNSTLAIHAPKNASAADAIIVRIDAADYAAYDITLDGESILTGDTAGSDTIALRAPSVENETTLRVGASMRACGGKQRASARITLLPASSPIAPEPSSPNSTDETPVDTTGANETDARTAYASVITPPLATADAVIEKEEAVHTREDAERPSDPPRTTIVYDQHANAIPWIALFGSIVVITSAIVFALHLRHERDSAPAAGKKSEDESKNESRNEGRNGREHGGKGKRRKDTTPALRNPKQARRAMAIRRYYRRRAGKTI